MIEQASSVIVGYRLQERLGIIVEAFAATSPYLFVSGVDVQHLFVLRVYYEEYFVDVVRELTEALFPVTCLLILPVPVQLDVRLFALAGETLSSAAFPAHENRPRRFSGRSAAHARPNSCFIISASASLLSNIRIRK